MNLISTEPRPAPTSESPAAQAKKKPKLESAIESHAAAIHAAEENTPRRLREFGLLVGGVFLAIGLFSLYRQKPAGPYCAAIGSVLLLLGLVAPTVLGPIYTLWMKLARVMGTIMTTVILSVAYFLLMTPIAFIMRIMGQDPLNLKLDKAASSYWHMRPNAKPGDAEHFRRTF